MSFQYIVEIFYALLEKVEETDLVDFFVKNYKGRRCD